jgi:hypothetical protein
MNRHRIREKVVGAAVALGFALAFVWGAAAGAGSSAIPDKTKKQIRVMEGMLDSILLDSPNLLVAGSHVTHGVYLDEFGVVLAFEASLTGGGFDFGRSLKFLQNIRVESDKDKTVIWHEKSEGDEEESPEAEAHAEQDEGSGEGQKEKVIVLRRGGKGGTEEGSEKDAAESEKETYGKGKQELIDALVDYGETLTSLRDDQWVAIAAFLKDNQYFSDQSISRLVIKARMRDLRASGQISREALLGRLVVEEY